MDNKYLPNTVIAHIVETHTYFHNVHQDYEWFVEQGCLIKVVILQMPNDMMEFSSYVKSFGINYHKYREAALEHSQEFSKYISKILDIWVFIKKLCNMKKNHL